MYTHQKQDYNFIKQTIEKYKHTFFNTTLDRVTETITDLVFNWGDQKEKITKKSNVFWFLHGLGLRPDQAIDIQEAIFTKFFPEKKQEPRARKHTIEQGQKQKRRIIK